MINPMLSNEARKCLSFRLGQVFTKAEIDALASHLPTTHLVSLSADYGAPACITVDAYFATVVSAYYDALEKIETMLEDNEMMAADLAAYEARRDEAQTADAQLTSACERVAELEAQVRLLTQERNIAYATLERVDEVQDQVRNRVKTTLWGDDADV